MCAAATRYLRKACDELREATRLNPNNAMAISELAKIIFRFGGDTPEMVNKRRALGIAKMKHAIQIAIPATQIAIPIYNFAHVRKRAARRACAANFVAADGALRR